MIAYAEKKDNPFEENKCEHCSGSGYRFNVTNSFILQVSICCNKEKNDQLDPKEANCISFNSIKLDINKNITPAIMDKIERKIRSPFFNMAFKSFFYDKLPKVKKEIKHSNILENPHDKRLARPIEDHQVTNMHLFNRNAVFLIISDQYRKKYTKTLNGEIVDISETRVFDGWADTKFVVTGPILCDYDKKIFDACLKLHHEKGFIGLALNTTLNEIWNTLGNKKGINNNNINSIKRSLKRLASVGVEVRSPENKNFWVGGILDNVVYQNHENNKYSKIIINFNTYMVKIYLNGAYSTYSFPILNGLGIYAKRLLEFMGTHKEPDRIMSLSKWREVIGVNPDMEMKYFKKRMKEGIEEMKKFDLISEWTFKKNLAKSEDLIYVKLNIAKCNAKELIPGTIHKTLKLAHVE